MRKTIIIFTVICLLFALNGCMAMQTLSSGGTETQTHPVSGTEPATPNLTVPTTMILKEEAEYISDRRVQYNEATEQFVVFFGLQNSHGKYVSGSGEAEISIVDEKDNCLFQQNISFSPLDFTDWTNQSWDEPRYMCGLYIDRNKISESLSSSGKLTIKVVLSDGSYFDGYTTSIYDLPEKQVQIVLPELPAKTKDVSYSYTSYSEVRQISYESRINYDGTASVTMELVVTLTEKSAYQSRNDSLHIGYKLLDSTGVIVDSGTIYVSPLGVGESARETEYFYDLNPNEIYTLKLLDES